MDTNLQGHRWLLFKVSYGRVKRKKKSKSGQFYSYFTVGTAFFIGALVICRKESSQSLGNTNHNGKYGGNEERVTTHYFLLFQYQKEGEKDRNVGKMRQKAQTPVLKHEGPLVCLCRLIEIPSHKPGPTLSGIKTAKSRRSQPTFHHTDETCHTRNQNISEDGHGF